VRSVASKSVSDDHVVGDGPAWGAAAPALPANPQENAARIAPAAALVTPTLRAAQKQQVPVCIWITGLPGSGKSTIARALDSRLTALGRHTFILDGDQLRAGLNRDLGFTPADRAQNVRRAAEVARLMLDAGLIVICAFISPHGAERRLARERIGAGDFLEVYLDVTSAVCEARDPKGHYAKARRGEITGFTGIDGSYEAPVAPDLRLDTSALELEACVERILALLSANSAAA
jgi:bifunctional enzyme CysN/CysC